MKHSPVFNSLSEENKNWVLGYLCGWKAVIPYEKIKTFDDLDCVPEGEFFTETEFYSSLRNEIISDEDYENVKFFLANHASKKIVQAQWHLQFSGHNNPLSNIWE